MQPKFNFIVILFVLLHPRNGECSVRDRRAGDIASLPCNDVLDQAKQCYREITRQLDVIRLLPRSNDVDLKRRGVYCAQGSQAEDKDELCVVGLRDALKRCNCQDQCSPNTNLDEFANDFNVVCKKPCSGSSTFEWLTGRLDYCVTDLPIEPLQEGKYKAFCESWEKSTECVRKLALVGSCNKAFLESVANEMGKKKLPSGQFEWIQGIAGTICTKSERCDNDRGLVLAEDCTRHLRGAIAVVDQPTEFCRALSTLFVCTSQSTDPDCLTIEDIISQVYANLTWYRTKHTTTCQSILQPTTATTTPPATNAGTSTTQSTTPSTTTRRRRRIVAKVDVASGKIEAADTVVVVGKAADGPWKPCKGGMAAAKRSGSKGLTPTRVWILTILGVGGIILRKI